MKNVSPELREDLRAAWFADQLLKVEKLEGPGMQDLLTKLDNTDKRVLNAFIRIFMRATEADFVRRAPTHHPPQTHPG